MSIVWKVLHKEDLNIEVLYDILELRCRVFVVEQTCPYQDIDGLDLKENTVHVLGFHEDKIVAYSRILHAHEGSDKIGIGRVIIDPSMRGIKLGYKLIEKTLEEIKDSFPNKKVALAAQAHLQGFYSKFGFQAVSEIYLEDDIPHIDMVKA